MADAEVEEEVEETFPDEEDLDFWWRFERFHDRGRAFPADIALSLAALRRVDTVTALKLLAKCGDAELAARILI